MHKKAYTRKICFSTNIYMEKEVMKTKQAVITKGQCFTQTEIRYNDWEGQLLRDKYYAHKGLEISIQYGRIKESQKKNVILLSFEFS